MRVLMKGSMFVAMVLALLLTSAPLRAQGFGAGVAVSGSQVLIGEQGGPTTTGMVYVYERTGGNWDIISTLRPDGAENGIGFGRAVSAVDDRMLVGSAGAAYVFDRHGDEWTQAATLETTVGEGLTFGTNVTIQGDRALVSAGGGGFFRAGPAGEVYVFERGEAGWKQTGRLVSPDASDNDGFGSAMALRGDYAVVGAPGADAGSTRRAGAVYTFHRDEDGTWGPEGDPLVAPDGTPNARFGAAVYPDVTADGVTMFVSAPGAAGRAGVVYSFDNVAGAWVPANRFFPPVMGIPGRRSSGAFGTAITVVGNELWIGAGGLGMGEVLRYTRTDRGWKPDGSMTGAGLERGDGYGGRLAIGEDVAAVVATGKDYRMGTAFLYEREGAALKNEEEVWTEPGNFAAVEGGEVDCTDGVASAFGCSDVDILSFMPVADLGAGRGVHTNDVWGWTDEQTGREYALVGMTDQASFVDITDPQHPRLVGWLPKTEGASGSVWRDMKVYKNYAFIVSDGAGQHGMQVFDLTRLRDVGSDPVEFTVDALYDGIASAHNVVIDEATGFAYAVGSSGGGETCGGGLHMIDIRTPTQPTFAGCFADTSTGRRNTGYTHDAQCVAYHGPDTEHQGREVCFGSNETAVSIADVTDKSHPVALSTAEYPNVGYTHQGWLTQDQRYFYLGDELDEIQQANKGTPFPGTRTLIWDVSDLDDPVFLGEHFGVSTASDHNIYIVGNLMYQSNYNSGLRILDISEPANPKEVAYLDTVPYAEGPQMGGSWSNYPFFASGTIVVTSGNEGLFLLKHHKRELVP